MSLDINFYVQEHNDSVSYSEHPLKLINSEVDPCNYFNNSIDIHVDITIRYNIGYFNKFNALHGLITSTFCDTDDDSRNGVELSKDDIKFIQDILKRVASDHTIAPIELPVYRGFCFGSYNYDDVYYQHVNQAICLFESILSCIDFEKYSIVYRANW